jgi:thiol:disulfide interchange protein
MKKLLASLVGLVLSLNAYGQVVHQPHLTAELVAATSQVKAGQTLLVGLRMKMDPNWHTYWRNPGDSGEPTHVEWKLPAGFSASPLLWPPPSRIAVPPLTNFGYDGEVFLLTEIVAGPRPAGEKQATLHADASWLVCNDVCIPGKASLNLQLPWTDDNAKDSSWFAELDRVRTTIPSAMPQWKGTVSVNQNRLTLNLLGPTGSLTGAEFYPYSETLIQNAADQKVVISDSGIQLETIRSQFAEPGEPSAESLAGVMVLKGTQTAAIEIAPTLKANSGLLWEALLFAFLGGLVLNLMPCVFPVLCLKVLSFAQLGGAERRKSVHHAGAYTVGILVSFWALAGTLIALRAGGQALGWGFQLQSPSFLAALTFLLLGLSLNLFGVFEVGGSMMGVGQKYATQEGWAGAFFSGVLATVVATPCTAPFMGTAMGYALGQPALIALAVFTFLGLGLAAPYVLFSAFPQLTQRLPRPGNWMVIFKQLMAFPLLATAWWMVSVLALQSSLETVFHLLLALIVFSMGLWIFGLNIKSRAFRLIASLILVVGSIFWTLRNIQNAPTAAQALQAKDGWQPFTEETLTQARKSGHPVFIDFTAAWCITCQVNERVALETEAVQDRFAQKKVVLLRADWTNQDPIIAKRLESYGRNGVPLYVLYPAGENSQPKILPQLLTPDIVLTALDSL